MAKKKFNLLVPSTFPSNVSRERCKEDFSWTANIYRHSDSRPLSSYREEEMKLWIEKFIAAIAFQEEEEEERRSGSRCLAGEERGRIIKMRGNSIPVGEEEKKCFDANVRACVVVVAYSPFILGENWVLFRVPPLPPSL